MAKLAKSHVHDVIAHRPNLPLSRHVQEAGLANVRFAGDHLARVTKGVGTLAVAIDFPPSKNKVKSRWVGGYYMKQYVIICNHM